jgi:hypothetical protein
MSRDNKRHNFVVRVKRPVELFYRYWIFDKKVLKFIRLVHIYKKVGENFAKIGHIAPQPQQVCTYVCTYVCMYEGQVLCILKFMKIVKPY